MPGHTNSGILENYKMFLWVLTNSEGDELLMMVGRATDSGL